jgi:uncharacterized protein YfdQ (DUF2303 family)
MSNPSVAVNGLGADESGLAVKELVELGKALGSPQTHPFPQGEPFTVVPNGMQVKNLGEFAPPSHVKVTCAFTEPDSFVAYVNRFKSPRTQIFAAVTDATASLRAVIDYHAPAGENADCLVGARTAARCAHVATYDCVPTAEWQRWCAANGKKFTQVEFATWLEDNQTLFVEPSGAELLELALTLEGIAAVRFNSQMRMADGKNSLMYEEDVEVRGTSSTKGGQIVLPQAIVAVIQPFHGVDNYKVQARLKTRVEGRKLTVWFETIAMHRIVRDAVKGVLASVTEKTGIVPLAGKIA